MPRGGRRWRRRVSPRSPWRGAGCGRARRSSVLMPSGADGRRADLVLGLPDDLDGDAGRLGDALGGVGGIGEGAQDEGEAPPRRPQQRDGAVAVLHRGRVALQDQRAAVGVHHGVALAPPHLLARVVAARPAGLAALDALAVDHRGRRAGVAPGVLAVEHDQVVGQRLPHARVAECGEPAVDGLVRREALRQHAPGDAAAQDVEDRVDDLAHRPGRWPSDRRWGR